MDYSITMLPTASDCQALIDNANREKQILSYKKEGFAIKRSDSTLTSADIEADLAEVTAQLPAMQSFYESLPAGPAKEAALLKLSKAQVRKLELESRKPNYGITSMVEREFDISCVEKSIEEADVYIAALTARKDELTAK